MCAASHGVAVMKHGLLAGLLTCLGIVFVVSVVARSPQNAASTPWQVGKCYRVELAISQRWIIYRVLDPLADRWLRVQPVPQRPSAGDPPGWLNVDQVLMVYDAPCTN